MKKNFFSWLLLAGFTAWGLSSAFADEEQDLIVVLQSAAGAPQKCDACQRLRLIGTVKSVPALSALLAQPATAHAARYALEGMPFPQSVAAMRAALDHTSGAIKAGLIDSLGWRRDTDSAPLLRTLLSDTDPVIAAAAGSALGRIGGKEAIAALTAACDAVPPAVQPAVLDGLARCADQVLASGDAQAAAAIYRKLLVPTFPMNIRVAAWRGLVLAEPAGRVELVSRALAGQEPALRLAALKVLRELNDVAVVDALLGESKWKTLPAAAQLAALDARVRLGGNILPSIRTAAQSEHVAVRVAAWQALGDSGDATTIPALAAAAASGQPPEREAARDALGRLHGPGVHDALLAELAGAAPEQKVELLRAIGEREESNATGALLENAQSGTEAVRLAALDSLRMIADPNAAVPLISVVAKARSDAESERALEALEAACRASRDKAQLSIDVLGAMKPLSPAAHRLVLPVLAELGTPAGLEAALAASQDLDRELAKQAVRVLAQWPNATPATNLLHLASTTADPALQVLALRGCINVSAQEPNLTRRLALLQNVLTLAKRADEKKQALGQIGQVPTREALQVAMGHLADPELVNEAGLAALTIAEKLAGKDPELARETADKVLAQCHTPDIVQRAWSVRGKPPGGGPFIQDWLVCGPFSKPGVTGAMAVFNIPFGPEVPDAKAQWKPLPLARVADLSSFFPEQFNCVAYLKTQIIAPGDCDAALLLGSDDGVKAWLNGAVVHSQNVDRGLVEDQDMAPIHLRAGVNDLLLKITQGGGGWAACARIVGTDGRPIQGLKVHTDR
ncbi:MAG TPA: HEAT repeat domain-containing protein [Verrucomicrobiae bacterium]|nr:HEAT repeat domain-containing protein [Verrucomicrobiae bacterium]